MVLLMEISSGYNEAVSAEVRAEMARQRVTGTRLAVECGWKQPYLSRRITGAVPWTTNDLEQIARKLGIPIDALTSPRALSA